jgi:hypothetical protein
MNDLVDLAAELQSFFKEKDWKFCFIGGLAIQRWGMPRLTNDVDITLFTGFGSEENFIYPLLEKFKGRVSKADEFAIRQRVLLLENNQGIGIDIALGGLAFEESAIKRATAFEYLPGIYLTTCSAEDLIVMKAFANRLQDWIDIEQVITRNFDALDWDYIQTQLKPLCDLKEDFEIVPKLLKLRDEVGDSE